METALYVALIAILSYLLGSIPTGVIISKLFFKFDIREQGSGNMGSTNTFRVLGVKWGIVVQLFDLFKGYAAVAIIANYLGQGITFPNATSFEHITLLKILAGLMSIFGHI